MTNQPTSSFQVTTVTVRDTLIGVCHVTSRLRSCDMSQNVTSRHGVTEKGRGQK